MFGRSNTPQQMPADVSTHTLAGSAALGGSGVSGQVAPWNAVPAVPLTPAGYFFVQQNAQALPDLPADSLYTDRALRGGVQTLSSQGEFIETPAFMGGFTLMANRQPIPTVEWQQMSPEYASATEWRDTPAVTDLCRTTPTVARVTGMTGKGSVN